jgi:membrane protein required for colicin V production
MTPYDAAMIGVVVLGMIWGAFKGITWQLASIASLVLGYMFAYPLSAQLAPHFPGEPVVARSLALLAAYAAVSGGVFVVAWLVRATLRQWKFEAFDRHLGMILGGLEGALLGVIATMFVVSLAPQTRTPIFASRAGQVVAQVMDSVGPILPGEIRKELAPFWNGTGVADSGEPMPIVAGPARSDANLASPAGDGDSTTAALQELVKEGESRVGRALRQAAEKGAGWTAQPNDRTIERR